MCACLSLVPGEVRGASDGGQFAVHARLEPAGVGAGDAVRVGVGVGGRGLHLLTLQLNLSRFLSLTQHTDTEYPTNVLTLSRKVDEWEPLVGGVRGADRSAGLRGPALADAARVRHAVQAPGGGPAAAPVPPA
jgi:hypothetical protein